MRYKPFVDDRMFYFVFSPFFGPSCQLPVTSSDDLPAYPLACSFSNSHPLSRLPFTYQTALLTVCSTLLQMYQIIIVDVIEFELGAVMILAAILAAISISVKRFEHYYFYFITFPFPRNIHIYATTIIISGLELDIGKCTK